MLQYCPAVTSDSLSVNENDMKKSKNRLPSQDDLTELLNTVDLTNGKGEIKAYQSVVINYPELILFENFQEIIKTTTDPDKISVLILKRKKKPRKERDDSDYSKRNSNKYKGRKKDKIWNTFKATNTILSEWDNWKWEQVLTPLEDKFDSLIYAVIKYLSNTPEGKRDINKFSSLSEIQNLSDKKTIDKFISQLFVLGDIFITFLEKLDTAEEQKNKTFLNKVSRHFSVHEDSNLLTTYTKGKGRNINWKTMLNRLKTVKEYISSDKKAVDYFKKGTDFTQSKDEYLIYLASRIYIHFYDIPLRTLKRKNKRLEAIIQIRELMQKHYIRIEDITPAQKADNLLKTGLRTL